MPDEQPTVFVIDDLAVREAISGARSVGLRAETFESAQDFLTKELHIAKGDQWT
jgi:hypothetical protein